MLEVPGGSESQQVMLQVRFAEVNRRAISEAGIALFANRAEFSARSTTQQFAAPDFDDSVPGGLVFADYLNLFFLDREHGIGGVSESTATERWLPESRGAQPDCLQRPGSEFSSRR